MLPVAEKLSFLNNKVNSLFQTSIFSGALYIQLALGWNMYLAIGVLLFLTGLFTILGITTLIIYIINVQPPVRRVGATYNSVDPVGFSADVVMALHIASRPSMQILFKLL